MLLSKCGCVARTREFLLRLVEQEMLDRDLRAAERRIKAAKFRNGDP